MPERFHLAIVQATLAARITIWAVGLYGIWQGAGIIRGGPLRFAGPTFVVLRLVPFPTLIWGWWLILAGLAVITGSALRQWWVKAAGLIGVAVWSVTFAIGAFQAVRVIPTVPNTGGKTYALIAFVAVVLLFIDERKRTWHVRR